MNKRQTIVVIVSGVLNGTGILLYLLTRSPVSPVVDGPDGLILVGSLPGAVRIDLLLLVAFIAVTFVFGGFLFCWLRDKESSPH